MADKKISALTASTTPLAGTEVLPIVQSGATVKVAVSDLTAGRAVSASSLTASTDNFIVGTTAKGITTGSSIPLGFGVNNTVTAMTLDTNGSLLLGVTSALAAGFKQSILIGSGGGGTIYKNNTDGNYALQFLNAAGSTSGWIQVNTTTTTYNSISDVRLKHDIADAPEASNLIDAIQVRSFKWNADKSHQRYGFVAQELFQVAPEAVSQPTDPEDMMGVDYSKLVPMLVKEIQSLRARVAQLEQN